MSDTGKMNPAECRDAIAGFGVKINAAYARIRQAREAAGVKPGEPLLNLNLDEHDPGS